MTVRYNRVFAIVLLVLGVINTLLGVWLLALGSLSPSLLTGILILVIGYSYLSRPYFIIEAHQVVVPAPLGPIKRTYNFPNDTYIKMENSRLFVRSGGNWKRIRVYRWLSDSTDWQAMEAKLTSPVTR